MKVSNIRDFIKEFIPVFILWSFIIFSTIITAKFLLQEADLLTPKGDEPASQLFALIVVVMIVILYIFEKFVLLGSKAYTFYKRKRGSK